MKWKTHDKWAQKLGISKEVSNYVNRVVDNINVPEDFKKHTEKRKISTSRGKNFAIRDITENLHDRGKDKHIQELDLQFLSMKGKNYVKAYYLHFILDYLVSLKDWMGNTGESIEDCIGKYQKNKAVAIPRTKEQLIEVMNLLKNNIQELKKDLDL